MAVKVYISLIGQSHFTTIKVNGRDKRIHFCGAERDENGTITTGNKEEQEGIESAPGYGKAFTLSKILSGETQENTAPQKVEIISEELNIEELAREKIIQKVIQNTPVTEIGDIKGKKPKELVFRTIIQAQEYLAKEPFNMPKSKIRTQSEIQTKGLEFGLSISFNKD
jgi:hypothetical protein